MSHEERVERYYPDYRKVGENFNPKREWPKDEPMKKKKLIFIPIFVFLCIGLFLGFISTIYLVDSGKIPIYTKSENLNESYLNGSLDAIIKMMEHTKETGTTFIIMDGENIQVPCFIPQNLNNITGGK